MRLIHVLTGPLVTATITVIANPHCCRAGDKTCNGDSDSEFWGLGQSEPLRVDVHKGRAGMVGSSMCRRADHNFPSKIRRGTLGLGNLFGPDN
jgi:hypothetical protein